MRFWRWLRGLALREDGTEEERFALGSLIDRAIAVAIFAIAYSAASSVPGKLAWGICIGVAARLVLTQFKRWLFAGTVIAIQVEDPGDDGGDDDGQETAAPIRPAVREEIRAEPTDHHQEKWLN